VNADLEKWIDEASKGLEPLAREKITEQITEHYEDSVAGYRSSGLSEVDACSRAIVDLGSSRKMHKQLRSQYFSLAEFSYLNRESKQTLFVVGYSLGSLVFSFIVFLEIAENNFIGYLYAILIIFWNSSYFLIGFINRQFMFLSKNNSEKITQIIIHGCFMLFLIIHLLDNFIHIAFHRKMPNERDVAMALSTAINIIGFLWFINYGTKFVQKVVRRARALSK